MNWVMRALWLRRVGFSLCLALALGYLPYRVYQKSGLHRYVELRAELAELAQRNQGLRREVLRLRGELEAIGPPPNGRRAESALPLAAVERAARDELGLVRAGEIVFQLTPEASR
jgi:cell division protein FtsB